MDTVDREAIYAELRRVRVTFRRLVEEASPDDLARASSGTRWTNQELLFHMLFGYLITRALIVLGGMFARLPASASRIFAGRLDAAGVPFDRVNYLGSRAGARIFPRRRLAGKLDRVTMALERRLRAETSARLGAGMHYPMRWDPFFKDFMTLADIYHYPTQHFDFHQRQLTLGHTEAGISANRGSGPDGQSAIRSLEGLFAQRVSLPICR
jgi:hypothetical protein